VATIFRGLIGSTETLGVLALGEPVSAPPLVTFDSEVRFGGVNTVVEGSVDVDVDSNSRRSNDSIAARRRFDLDVDSTGLRPRTLCDLPSASTRRMSEFSAKAMSERRRARRAT